MKKIIFAIFAHPDDEAFGPSGTLLMEAKAGTEIHLICLTAGEGGMNPDNHTDLGVVRLHEWQHAGQMMGASGMYHLGYHDGELSNNFYHRIVADIETVIDDVLIEQAGNSQLQIEIMSNDFNGISGHLDHILAARVAAYTFYMRKKTDHRFTRLRLSCIPDTILPERNIEWLYMEAGRKTADINEVIDAREYADEVFQIMRAHHTQRRDCESHIARLGRDVALNHFIVLE